MEAMKTTCPALRSTIAGVSMRARTTVLPTTSTGLIITRRQFAAEPTLQQVPAGLRDPNQRGFLGMAHIQQLGEDSGPVTPVGLARRGNRSGRASASVSLRTTG